MPAPLSSRSVWILLTLGVLAAAGWWLMHEDTAPLPDDGPVVNAESEPTPYEPRGGTTGRIETVPFDPEMDSADAPDAETGPSLVLVRDRSGAPVEGATVTLLRPQDQRNFWSEDQEARPLRTLKTDAKGLAAISPLPRRSLMLEAQHGDALGVAEFRQGDAPDALLPEHVVAAIVLEPIKHIEAVVTTPQGAPQGGVRVRLTDSSGMERMMRGEAGRDRRGEADPRRGGMGWRGLDALSGSEDGIARFALSVRSRDIYDATELRVTAELVAQPNVETTLQPAPEGVSVARLEIPLSTVLALQLVDAAGRPLQENAQVFVRTDTPAAPATGRMFENPMAGSARIRLSDGQARIGGVKAGVTLKMTASARERSSAETSVLVPQGVLEHKADVAIGARLARVSLTLHDEENQVVPWFTFTASLRSATQASGTEADRTSGRGRGPDRMTAMFGGGMRPLTTDIEGRAQISVSAAGGTLELRAESLRNLFQGGGSEPMATVAVPPLAEGQTLDLGVVKLSQLAVLARGRVLRADDSGVTEITVRAGEPGSDAENGGRRGQRGGFGGDSSLGSAQSGKDGIFKIYGARPENGRVELSVSSREAAVKPVTVEAGARDVVLRLLSTGALAGSVKLADPSLDLSIEVLALSAVLPEREVRARPDKEGQFTLQRLPAGACRVSVRVNGVEDVAIEGVMVVADQRSTPDSLSHLIVGQRWMRGVVEVRDAAGGPVKGARVQLRSGAGGGAAAAGAAGAGGFGGAGGAGAGGGRRGPQSEERTDELGRATLIVDSTTPRSVQVSHQDFMRADFADVSFPLFVQLSRGLSCTVTLPAEAPLPAERTLRLFLMPANAGDAAESGQRSPPAASAAVDAGTRTATFDHLAAGRYSIHAMGGGMMRQRGAAGTDPTGAAAGGRGRARDPGGNGAAAGAGPQRRTNGPGGGFALIGTLELNAQGAVQVQFDPAALAALTPQ